MEKIKIDKKDLRNVTVKFNGDKISIKPYINTKELTEIAGIVYDNYFANEDIESRMLSSVVVENAYLYAVAKVMTNIDVSEDGILEYISETELRDIIRDNVKNYDEYLKSIYFSIQQKNEYDNNMAILGLLSDLNSMLDENLKSTQNSLSEVSNDIKTNVNEFKETLDKKSEIINDINSDVKGNKIEDSNKGQEKVNQEIKKEKVKGEKEQQNIQEKVSIPLTEEEIAHFKKSIEPKKSTRSKKVKNEEKIDIKENKIEKEDKKEIEKKKVTKKKTSSK